MGEWAGGASVWGRGRGFRCVGVSADVSVDATVRKDLYRYPEEERKNERTKERKNERKEYIIDAYMPHVIMDIYVY